MARGNILTVDLPAPASRAGHEQIGYRPAIVVQTDATDTSLPTTMIVPLTANLGALRFPHTLQVDPSPQNGLARPSVLLVFQLRAIDKKRLGNRIGQLEQHHLQQLEAEIRNLLAL
jgi:mRNA interferase MazF